MQALCQVFFGFLAPMRGGLALNWCAGV